MSIDEYIIRFTAAAEFERTHGNLQGCLEFRQLVEWLKELKENKDVLDKIREEIEQASYEYYFEYGEYIGEDTRKERIINTNKVLQIIDKYMEGEQE